MGKKVKKKKGVEKPQKSEPEKEDVVLECSHCGVRGTIRQGDGYLPLVLYVFKDRILCRECKGRYVLESVEDDE